MDTIDTYWVPESFMQSKTVLRQYCPAGINESSIDYDISLNAASLIQVCGEYIYERISGFRVWLENFSV